MAPTAAPVDRETPSRRLANKSSIDVDRFTESDTERLSNLDISRQFPVAPNTVTRWQNVGCRGADGLVHLLPFMKIGKRRYTHRRDLIAFLEAINARA